MADSYPAGFRLLARLEPERSHAVTVRLLQATGASDLLSRFVRRRWGPPQTEPIRAFGLLFRNRLGIAGGYDKDGRAWRGLAALGFGHVEIGTVTPLPQPGNRKPRLCRIPEQRAIINHLGFPSRGAKSVAGRLADDRSTDAIIGINMGLGASTSVDDAQGDYLTLLDTFGPLADYVVVNVSSPNTPGLRHLAAPDALEDLLTALTQRRAELALRKQLPMLLKISPDLSDRRLDETLAAVDYSGFDGIVATNTTARPDGGLSGAPLSQLATDVVGKIHKRTGGTVPIVASGGVMSADDAKAKIAAGASLVQVYTGLVYRGPRLIKEIVAATG